MSLARRQFILAAAALPAAACIHSSTTTAQPMYGLIGKCTAVPGQRDALIKILLEGTQSMPGCLSYVVALDENDADAIWITEVWDSEASHAASLKLPQVRDAITRAKPLFASFGPSVKTRPVGGVGLST